VRAFAEAVFDTLNGAGIDALVHNAGAQFPNVDQRTEDGFERTFVVNHLAQLFVEPGLPEHGTSRIMGLPA